MLFSHPKNVALPAAVSRNISMGFIGGPKNTMMPVTHPVQPGIYAGPNAINLTSAGNFAMPKGTGINMYVA